MNTLIVTLCEHCKAAADMSKQVAAKNPEIVHFVCGTIVLIACITAITILLWKLIEFWSESSKAKRERKKATEDAKRTQIAEYRNKELEALEKKEEIITKLNSYIQDLQKP